MTDLTVSIVSHGHGSMVAELLRDLDQDAALAGVRVVLTLNIPDQHFEPSDYTHICLLVLNNSTPKGFGANHNAAFAHCETRWFLILNPDVRVGKAFAGSLIDCAVGIDRIGMIAPLVVGDDGRAQDSVRPLVTPWSIVSRVLLGRRPALLPPRTWRQGESFYWLAGMFLLVDASAFKAVDGFDERFFLYYEDYDLSARLYLAGYALAFHPEVQVIHQAQRSSHRSMRYLRWHLTSLLRLWLTPPFWRLLPRR